MLRVLGPWLYLSQHSDIHQLGFLHNEARIAWESSMSVKPCVGLLQFPDLYLHWQTLDVACCEASWWSWSWPFWLAWWFHPSTTMRVSIPWWNPCCHDSSLSFLVSFSISAKGRTHSEWALLVYLLSSEFSRVNLIPYFQGSQSLRMFIARAHFCQQNTFQWGN